MKFKNWNIDFLPRDFDQHPGIYLTASLLVVIAAVFVLNINPILQRPIALNTYEECLKLPDSVIQESYPSVCVTSDGQRFVQPTPTPTSQSTQSATSSEQLLIHH